MKKELKIEYDKQKKLFYCTFPSSTPFVAAIRRTFRNNERLFDTQKRRWVIKAKGLTRLVRIGYKYFDTVDLSRLPADMQESFQKAKPDESQGIEISDCSESPYTILHVLPTAPRCVISAAYKALALLVHPDHNPKLDGSEFRKLNEAFKEIEETWTN
jgi:hypothetical protein